MKKTNLLKLCLISLLSIFVFQSCDSDETTDDISQTQNEDSDNTDDTNDSNGSQESSPAISAQTFSVAEN